MNSNFLPTLYQEFIYKSRYARFLDNEKRRENWDETVARYFNFMTKHLETKCGYKLSTEERKELEEAVLSLQVMPSMRALMTAGPSLEKDNTCAYNCAYVAVDDIKVFDEAMLILMMGTGVGFSVERQYTSQLPEIPQKLYDTDTTIIVKDSKEGWSKALRQLIALLYSGEIPKWNVSKVRPAGARLKTFGGRASGPEPLVDLFKFTVRIFRNAAGRKLTSIECHDIMCKIGEVVVVGGVRRSAMISLSNVTDERMRMAKTGSWWETNPQRALSNNSAAYSEKPDMGIFMREWLSLYDSKSGERGIFSRIASQKQAIKFGRRDPNHEFGTNPCLHPDSLVETINGQVKIKDITEPTMVYSMNKDGKLCIKPSSASWISKKNAKTIKVTVSSGKQVICTPDHKIFIEGRGWVEAQNIHIGDKVVHLVRNRRGAAYSGVKLTSQDKRDFVMEHRIVYESFYGKIPEGYDIHHIDGNTYNNDIENLECLSHSDHAKLTALEQPNNHMVNGVNEKCSSGYGFISPSNSRGGEKTIISMPEELKSNLHQYANVVSIEEGPVTDVYDLTVEETHNFIANFVVVHNCSEIILRPNQFCNLTSIVVKASDDFNTLAKKARIAALLGTIQSTLTYFPYLRKAWTKNTEEERLLGVSLTGIMDNTLLNGKEEKNNLPLLLEALRNIVVETNKEFAEKLGIPQSVAATCVKPEGTSSQLNDSASGIHARHNSHYIRTVRCDNKDPLTLLMKSEGFPNEPCVMKPESTTVFSFPIKAPKGSITRNDMTAIEQLEMWIVYQRYWCEHKPSVTISVKEDEWMAVGAFVYENFDEISGVSFLPYSEHIYRQAPYQDCSEEEYEKAWEKMPKKLDWNKLAEYESEDNTLGSQTLACAAGACEIVDI